MPEFSSSDVNAYIALGVQTAEGTPQVTAARLRYPRLISGVNVQPERDVVDVREVGFGMDYSFSYVKTQKGAGQLVAFMRPEVGGLLAAIGIGAATWNGGSSPASHVFHTNHASYPWFTVIQQHPGSSLEQLFADSRISGFTLEGMAGEPWKWTIPFITKNPGASYADLTPTYFSDDAIIYHSGAPSYQLDGVADSTIESWKITAAISLEELQAQSVGLDTLVPQTRDLDIEVTRRYQNTTLFNKVYYGGGVAPTQSVATGSFKIVQAHPGSPTPFYELHAPLITWRQNAITEINPEGQTVKEVITGRLLRGATHSLILGINNAHASAYA